MFLMSGIKKKNPTIVFASLVLKARTFEVYWTLSYPEKTHP